MKYDVLAEICSKKGIEVILDERIYEDGSLEKEIQNMSKKRQLDIIHFKDKTIVYYYWTNRNVIFYS